MKKIAKVSTTSTRYLTSRKIGGRVLERTGANGGTRRKVGELGSGVSERRRSLDGMTGTTGTDEDGFRAVDARTGKILWSRKLGSGIISAPMSYRAPDGHQYIAIAAGVGGGAMTTASQPGFPARGSTYYVFTLRQNIPATQAASGSAQSAATRGEGNQP